MKFSQYVILLMAQPDPKDVKRRRRLKMKEMLTVEQAAKILGYTTAYVRTLAKQGKIQAYRMGRRWFFKEIELMTMFKSTSNAGLDI